MEFVHAEMTLSAAALKKRPYSLEKEFPFPPEDFSSFHPKEKRTKSNSESETVDVCKNLSESYSIFDSMLEGQEYLSSSDLDLMKDGHNWAFDFPTNFLSSLAGNDSPNCTQPTTFINDFYSSQETLLNSCNNVQTTPTSHNISNCYGFPVDLPSSNSTDIFCHLPEPNDEFFDINPNVESQNRNPPPPYPSSETFLEIDQRFGTCKTTPRRPTSIKLAPLPINMLRQQHLPDFSGGAFLPNTPVNFQCQGGETVNQQPKLPMMQSFLELKKSPRSPMMTDSNLASTSALPFQSLSPTLPIANNFISTARYFDEYATDTSLYHGNLLQTTHAGNNSQAMKLITIEPNVATSPDTTYSPTTPKVISDLSSSSWNTNLIPVNAHLLDAQCFPISKSDFQNLNNPLEMQLDRVQFNPKVVQSPGCEIENKASIESFFQETCKDFITVEAKIPKHNTLQALADKIKRNQTVKNRQHIDDVKPVLNSNSVDDGHLNGRMPGMNDPTISEENNPGVHPSKRGRINSCSQVRVTIGEADTSQESSSQDKKTQRRHKANKTMCADNSGLVATDLPTTPRNTNYLDSFAFNLMAPISSIKKPDKDLRTTYLNKGQYYALSMDCISERLRSAAFRTIVMVLFQDPASVGNELEAWKTWHNKQQSFKQRILDVDFKNACSGGPQEIEEMAFNATSVVWNGDSSITVNVAVNCLSTDFSNQKGVKGIPLLMQLDTYLDEELIHRAHCNIKVFCDKGAERKVRDEEKKNKEVKTNSEDSLNSPTSSTPPQFHSSNFHLSDDFSKVPLFFTPKPNVPIKTNSSRTFDSLFKSECQDCYTEVKSQTKPSKITLYLKDEEEVAFSELVFQNPTVQELLEAIASKFKLEKDGIKNIYKKSKKGILVNIDNEVLRHYASDSSYIVQFDHSLIPSISTNTYDVTLQEI